MVLDALNGGVDEWGVLRAEDGLEENGRFHIKPQPCPHTIFERKFSADAERLLAQARPIRLCTNSLSDLSDQRIVAS